MFRVSILRILSDFYLQFPLHISRDIHTKLNVVDLSRAAAKFEKLTSNTSSAA